MKPGHCECCVLLEKLRYRARLAPKIEEDRMMHPRFVDNPIADDEAIKKAVFKAAMRRWRGRVLLVLAGFASGFALAAAVLR